MALTFQTFSSGVRPLRVAVLTNSDDPEWQSSCLAIIGFLAKVWGGADAIIVPTDGTSIETIFWALLSAHDPDLVLIYRKTGEDLRTNQPDKFEEAVGKEVKKAKGVDPKQAHEEISRALSKAYLDHFTITDDLSKQIVTRLAPFAFEGKIKQSTVNAGCAPFYPLTAIVDVLDELEHPTETIEIKHDSGIPTLWIAAKPGWSTKEYFEALSSKGIRTTPVMTSQHSDADLISWAAFPPREFAAKTPFEISQLGLSLVRSTRSQMFKLPTVLVLGDSIRDFCLYYSLLRLYGRVLWIPSWFLENTDGFNLRLRHALSNAQDMASIDQAQEFRLTSATIPLTALGDLVRSLATSYPYISLSADRLSLELIAPLIRYPLRFYVTGSIDKRSTHQLLDDELPGTFESLKPASFRRVNPQIHRWIVEVAFLKHPIPRHPALSTLVATDSNLGEWSSRVGNDGLAFMCPGSFVMGFDPDFNLVRPSIRVPSALDIFRRTLNYCGYDCEISDKGKYESETIDKLGGIESSTRVFRDPELKAFSTNL